jgi:hypothetical protein
VDNFVEKLRESRAKAHCSATPLKLVKI